MSKADQPPRLQTLLQVPASPRAGPDSPKKAPSSAPRPTASAGSSSSSSKSRSVSFPADDSNLHTVLCYIETREELALDDLYFTRADYHMSRSAAKVISKEAERYGYSKNLVDTFVSTGKSPEIQDRLNLWCVHGHSRRGLERWANSKHGEDRQQDQFQAIMAVLRAQDDMLAKSNVLDCEKLRKVSHKATKTSRHFARMMGKADSYAMAQQLQQEQLEENGGSASAAASVADDASASRAVSDDGTDLTTATTDDLASTTSYDNISMPGGELKDTMHGPSGSSSNGSSSMTQRFKRFGFGRKKQGEERVSRVA